jgi:CRISPR/Cas system-associated protein Cas10 (large subunit of type III CRISPR-Cas system)
MQEKVHQCSVCGKEISSKNIRRHEDRCVFINESKKCSFCGRVCKNHNSLINHERLCRANSNRDISSFAKWNKEKERGENQFTKAISLGLSKPTISTETRKKLSDKASNQQWKSRK